MVAGKPTPQLVEDMVGSQNVGVAAIGHAAAECENARGMVEIASLRAHKGREAPRTAYVLRS